MLVALLVFFSLLWFCNTRFFAAWSEVTIGGDQLSLSLTALVIIIYLIIGAFGLVRWYYVHRRC